LLAIDAERALGENVQADKLVAELRKQYSHSNQGNPHCRFFPMENWRAEFMQVLQQSEKREFHCAAY
jgi:hypothetical protein